MASHRGRPRFALYSSTLGDYFVDEIRRLLACGLREWGADVVETNEKRGFVREADWHLIVSAPEFFYLGRGKRLRIGPWPPGVILYNIEQPQAALFSLVRRLAPRAHAVWDMELKTSEFLKREGWRADHLPLGWVDQCELFKPVLELPDLPLTSPLGPQVRRFAAGRDSFANRPVDLLFTGGRLPRRENFFASLKPLLSRYCGFVRLVDDSRFPKSRTAALHTESSLGLSQRAKIVLNLHRFGSYFEWHRIALHGIGQGALVISEPTNHASPFKAGRDFIEANLEKIPRTIDYYLSSDQGRRQAAKIAAQGLRTYRRACRFSRFIGPVMTRLVSSNHAATKLSRARVETAAALLRENKFS